METVLRNYVITIYKYCLSVVLDYHSYNNSTNKLYFVL